MGARAPSLKICWWNSGKYWVEIGEKSRKFCQKKTRENGFEHTPLRLMQYQFVPRGQRSDYTDVRSSKRWIIAYLGKVVKPRG